MLLDLRLFTIRNKGDSPKQSAFIELPCRGNPHKSGGLQSQLIFFFLIYMLVVTCLCIPRFRLKEKSLHGICCSCDQRWTIELVKTHHSSSSCHQPQCPLYSLPMATASYATKTVIDGAGKCILHKTLQGTWQWEGIYNSYVEAHE